jgi:crossover junction endodeoxyribonuclease RusA
MVKLLLPYPPSINSYWRHVGSRVLISKSGRQYRREVTQLCRSRRLNMLLGQLIVDVILYPPDCRRRDVDNSLKALLDALQHGGVYADDSQVVQLSVLKLEYNQIAPAGCATVSVAEIPKGVDRQAARTCLRCGDAFASSGPENRICSPCASINALLPDSTAIQRGQKYHNGEVME